MKEITSAFVKSSIIALFYSISPTCFAHTYFEGITDITVNKLKNRTEIVHRYTTHDLEVLLSESFNQRISANHSHYLEYLKRYFYKQFSLNLDNEYLTLNWVGVENGTNETIIYQTAEHLISLDGVGIKNHILLDFYPEQVNRTNYNDGQLSGTLIFDSRQQLLTIESSN